MGLFYFPNLGDALPERERGDLSEFSIFVLGAESLLAGVFHIPSFIKTRAHVDGENLLLCYL